MHSSFIKCLYFYKDSQLLPDIIWVNLQPPLLHKVLDDKQDNGNG